MWYIIMRIVQIRLKYYFITQIMTKWSPENVINAASSLLVVPINCQFSVTDPDKKITNCYVFIV